MKLFRYTKGPLLGVALLAATSCNDVIDRIKPRDVLDQSQALQTIEDYDAALIGVYDAFRSMYAFTYLALPEMMSDNTRETIESLANFLQETNWLYTSDALYPSVAWEQGYQAIFRANTIITTIERTPEKIPGQKNRILGQALALRGFAHFELLRFFGQGYDRNATQLGVVVKTTADRVYPARNTVQETYDQIFADLEQARILLADVDTEPRRPTRVSLPAVNAMLARVSLYAGLWQNAAQYATEAIDEVPLSEPEAFAAIWSDDATGETLWSVAYASSAEGRLGSELYFAPTDRNAFAPSGSLLALYDPDNDVRYGAYIAELPDRDAEPLVVGKYLGRGSANDNVVNAKIFRTGEMYLIRAEAFARLNQPIPALADLNDLRAARIEGYTPENLTGTALLNAIANERRRELAFEGHRFFDLRRTGQPINRGADCVAPVRSCVLPANSPKFAWPIPQEEVQNNPAMANQQNAGY